MRIFIINLQRRPDRWSSISENLSKRGLKFEQVYAIDARTDKTVQDQRRPTLSIILGAHGYLNGPIACYLSHRKIWQRMVAENIDQVLILEDDAAIHDWDNRILDVSIKEIGLDVLRIGTNSSPTNTQGSSFEKLNGQILDRDLLTDKLWGTVASIVTIEAARKYLKLKKYWFPVDHFHSYEKTIGLKSAITSPLFFIPYESKSDISVAKKSLTSFQSKILIPTKNLRRSVFYPLLYVYIRLCIELKLPFV
jgi:glycosyl transferase, family 25